MESTDNGWNSVRVIISEIMEIGLRQVGGALVVLTCFTNCQAKAEINAHNNNI